MHHPVKYRYVDIGTATCAFISAARSGEPGSPGSLNFGWLGVQCRYEVCVARPILSQAWAPAVIDASPTGDLTFLATSTGAA